MKPTGGIMPTGGIKLTGGIKPTALLETMTETKR